MKPMRRIDLWVGRGAALAGIVYVVLASLWPFVADAAQPLLSAADEDRVDCGRSKPKSVDVRIVGTIADIVVTRRCRARSPQADASEAT